MDDLTGLAEILGRLPRRRVRFDEATPESYQRLYDAKDALAAEVERLRKELEDMKGIAAVNLGLYKSAEADLRQAEAERDVSWAAFRRVCKDSQVTGGQLDLMTQMRDSEKTRADDAVAELEEEAQTAVSLRRELERLRKELALAGQVKASRLRKRAEKAEADQRAYETDVVRVLAAKNEGLERAQAAIERARALHARDDTNPRGSWCNTCLTAWPCRTFRTLDHPAPTETGEPNA